MNKDSFPTKTSSAEYVHGIDPLGAGNTPASPGSLNPGDNVDSNPDSANPPPTQRWNS